MTISIHIIRDRLTDGSEVFGVRIGQGGETAIDFDCVTEKQANSLRNHLLSSFEVVAMGGDVNAGDEIAKTAGWEG